MDSSEDRRQTSPETLMTTAREFTDCHDEKRLLSNIHQPYVEVCEYDHKRKERGDATAREMLRAAVVERTLEANIAEFRKRQRERSFRAAISSRAKDKRREKKNSKKLRHYLNEEKEEVGKRWRNSSGRTSVRPSTTLGRPEGQTFH